MSVQLRVISSNVNGRYGAMLPRQIARVRERDPDVVALQEVRTESRAARLDGLQQGGLVHVLNSSDLVGVRPLSGREYRRIYFNVIASRWPLERLVGLPLEFPEKYLAATVARDGKEFEVHNVHLPPGSTRGLVKVEMFEALHARLATVSERPRILCGDLNTPRAEHEDGTVEFWGDKHPPHAERWDDAERSVVLGLAQHDLPDAFRTLHGYSARDSSFVTRRKTQQWGRRYDHIFAARALGVVDCCYHHDWRKQRLSDHSAIEADFITG